MRIALARTFASDHQDGAMTGTMGTPDKGAQDILGLVLTQAMKIDPRIDGRAPPRDAAAGLAVKVNKRRLGR
jgi:hypothetical protein